jgi:hypothetical protein
MFSTGKPFRSVAWCLLVIGSLPQPVAGGEPTPQQLLSAYENHLKTYERATLKVHAHICLSGLMAPPGTFEEQSEYCIWRDKDRWKYLIDRSFQSPDNGALKSFRTTTEMLYPERGSVHVESEPDTRKVKYVVASLDELPETERMRIGAFEASVALNGYFGNGGVLLPAILRASSLTARKQQLSGQDLWVLEGTGAWGRHALWLDPNHGYLPRRIEQHKRGHDWIEPGKSVLSLAPGDGIYNPAASYDRITQRMDATTIKHVGNSDVVVAFTVTEETRFSNGQSVTSNSSFRFSDIDLRPDFSSADPFKINSPVPNGTPVQVTDHSGIKFEWRDGRIVKSVNASSLANLEDVAFIASRSMHDLGWRMPIIAGGTAAALVLVAWCARRWLNRAAA